MSDLTQLQQKLTKYDFLDHIELDLGAKGKLTIPKILLIPGAGKRLFISQLRKEGLSSEQIADLINKGISVHDPSRKQLLGGITE